MSRRPDDPNPFAHLDDRDDEPPASDYRHGDRPPAPRRAKPRSRPRGRDDGIPIRGTVPPPRRGRRERGAGSIAQFIIILGIVIGGFGLAVHQAVVMLQPPLAWRLGGFRSIQDPLQFFAMIGAYMLMFGGGVAIGGGLASAIAYAGRTRTGWGVVGFGAVALFAFAVLCVVAMM